MASGRCGFQFKHVCFNLDLLIGKMSSYNKALASMPRDRTDAEST